MKTNFKNPLLLISGLTFCAAVLFSGSAFAQEKPKGKPWDAPEADTKKANPLKSDEATLKDGKELYGQHCKSCHGVKGKGDGTKAAQIDISCGDFASEDAKKQSDGAFFWKVTEGRKPMPSFKEKLSDDERWKVVTYVKSLK